MKRTILTIIFILFFVGLSQGSDMFDFALDLYNNTDYYRAISEFNRFLFYFPDSTKRDDACLYIIKSYYYARQYGQVLTEIKKIDNKISNRNYKEQLNMFLARSYLYLGRDSFAYKIFKALESESDSPEIKENAGYCLVWIYIFRKDWQNAFKYLNEFMNRNPENKRNNEAILLREDIKKGVDFSPLSPALAGILSAIIPGSGQIYCKRTGDGLVAFALISLLSYGAYYYYNNGPDGMFYGLAILDLVFYLGNIYTAYGSAYKYNKNFHEQLKNDLINGFSF